MQGLPTPADAADTADRDLFLTGDGARLRPGDRFPNFLLPDGDGKMRWFIQHGQGHGQLVLLDPEPGAMAAMPALAPACAEAELDCIAIAAAAPAPGSPPSGFPVLIDSAGKIRPALRRMAGLPVQAPAAFLLDRNQRVLAIAAPGDLQQWGDFLRWGLAAWSKLKGPDPAFQIGQVAPVLTVPGVLSPDQCRALMERWHTHGHEAGQVTSLVKGEQVRRVYEDLKRRTDHRVSDPAVRKPLLALIGRRLGPELEKVFHYRNFHFDRVFIACYDSERGDFFRRHRDNQTPATASRRFALTINLNSEEHDGGELVFPEYGACRYKVPTGGAILFSCSLLHEALPVTSGRRFALLSFLRDASGPGSPGEET